MDANILLKVAVCIALPLRFSFQATTTWTGRENNCSENCAASAMSRLKNFEGTVNADFQRVPIGGRCLSDVLAIAITNEFVRPRQGSSQGYPHSPHVSRGQRILLVI
jgi:hypothetical protein